MPTKWPHSLIHCSQFWDQHQYSCRIKHRVMVIASLLPIAIHQMCFEWKKGSLVETANSENEGSSGNLFGASPAGTRATSTAFRQHLTFTCTKSGSRIRSESTRKLPGFHEEPSPALFGKAAGSSSKTLLQQVQVEWWCLTFEWCWCRKWREWWWWCPLLHSEDSRGSRCWSLCQWPWLL